VASVTPRPRFTLGKMTPGTHRIGGWVGLRAGLDAGARRKILCPCRGSNLDHPIIQPVVRHYTAWATGPYRRWEVKTDFQSWKRNEFLWSLLVWMLSPPLLW
jgi:hypothetical protein